VNYVKTELMPDFDFDAFSHENDEQYEAQGENNTVAAPVATHTPEEVEIAIAAAPADNSSSVEEWKI
jgi:hypothetical protein